MFEAKIAQGSLWKKLIDCIKDLVDAANLECTSAGISIQAIDQAHVALCNLLLQGGGFSSYNCEHSAVLGLNLASMAKVLKISDASDAITLRHENSSDTVTLVFDSESGNKTSEFQLKLMEIEAESMGIPEMEYRAEVHLPAADFAKTCRDMQVFGDTVTIQVSRDGIKFKANGDIGEGFAFFRATSSVDSRRGPKGEVIKSEFKVKNEDKVAVKKEKIIDDDNEPIVQKLTAKAEKVKDEPGSGKGGDKTTDTEGVYIKIDEPVNLSFALRYMNIFAKGSALSDRVTLSFAQDAPCMIEYKIEGLGFLRYYLAPKVENE